VRLRSDVERKRLFGLGPLDDSHAHGLDIYTPEATERTFAQLEDTARTLLQAGYPVIVDAAFLRRDQRDRFAAWPRPGQPLAHPALPAGQDELARRLAQRRAAGQDPSEATAAVLQQQQGHAQGLDADETAGRHRGRLPPRRRGPGAAALAGTALRPARASADQRGASPWRTSSTGTGA
jgi:predicted kinase